MWWDGGGLPAGALIVTVLGFGSGLATGWFVTAPVDWLLQRRRGAATADSYATPKYEQRWEVIRWGVALTFASVWVVLIWHALFDSGPVNSDQAGLPIWIPIGGPMIAVLVLGVLLSPFVALWWLIRKALGR